MTSAFAIERGDGTYRRFAVGDLVRLEEVRPYEDEFLLHSLEPAGEVGAGSVAVVGGEARPDLLAVSPLPREKPRKLFRKGGER